MQTFGSQDSLFGTEVSAMHQYDGYQAQCGLPFFPIIGIGILVLLSAGVPGICFWQFSGKSLCLFGCNNADARFSLIIIDRRC